MSENSSVRVGRVGALAIALGIGAATFALPGLAAADTEGSDGASASTNSSESSAPRASGHSAIGTRQRLGTGARQDAPTAGGASLVSLPTAAATKTRTIRPTSPTASPSPASSSLTSESVSSEDSSPLPAPQTLSVASSDGNEGAAAVVISNSRAIRQTVTSAQITPALPPAIAPLVQTIDAQTQSMVRTLFHGLENWLSTLPVNPVTDWLEGGLLLVRKSLFNQSAGVTATQTANSPSLVTGKIDVIDPDGDEWNIELVGSPTHGNVALSALTENSQANGIGAVTYTYTPSEGYAGDDQFVVKVTSATQSFNILDPFGLMSARYYTVAVGDAAEGTTTCFACNGSDPKDTLNTHLYLSDTAATVTVTKQGLLFPTYATTVTLSAAAANRSFAWMDTRGNMGSIPVDQMLTEDWSAFTKKAAENGVKPLLAFSYPDAGTDKAVFVDVSSVKENTDGTYTFSGQLMADAPAQEGRVDQWDFLGIKYKGAYESFLAASDLDNCQSGHVCSTVTAVGIIAATTLSTSAFKETGGHDYPLLTPGNASANQTGIGSMGPGETSVGQGNGVEWSGLTGNELINMTAMIPWGTDGSFIVATNMTQENPNNSPNGVFLYTAHASGSAKPTWTVKKLMDHSWNSAVTAMATYDQILLDPTGTPIPTSYTGTVRGGVDTSVLTLALPGDVNPGTLIGQQITGSGIADNTVISGFVSTSSKGTIFTVSNPIDVSDADVLVDSALPIAVTLPNVATHQPGLVVGTADGGIYYWNGTTTPSTTSGVSQGWTTLETDVVGPKMPGINTITSLADNQGLIFGLENGTVLQFGGKILADGSVLDPEWGVFGSEQHSDGSILNATIATGQNGGWASINYDLNDDTGFLQTWSDADQGDLYVPVSPVGGSHPVTLLPYDGTTLVGSIGGSPVVVDDAGNISTPAYASLLTASQTYVATTAGCTSSYGGGGGAGCSGYLLTVQETAGYPIRIGQTLYGGAGLLTGTTITQQISDGDGKLCADSCNAGGTGVYLVNSSQLVAPGTPMSASDGTGFIIGFDHGEVWRYDPNNPTNGGLTELQGDNWDSCVNTIIPWRDGFVAGLNNGAVMYWSPSNNPDGNNPNNPDALTYAGSTVTSSLAQASGWSQLHGEGWGGNAVTTMVQMGDGFALGLTAGSNSVNGAVEMFTGFGAVASDAAFGYQKANYGPMNFLNGVPVALTPSNSFTEVASVTSLSGSTSPNGSVQQLIAIPRYSLDSSGNVVLGTSLVAGLTNNGIYNWTSSVQDPSTETWNDLQPPGDGFDADVLKAAWKFGEKATKDWGSATGVGGEADPVFGAVANQAWCGTSCNSQGDYYGFTYSHPFGDDGVVYELGTTLQGKLNLTARGYGYVFVPNGFFDKFDPDLYSVGVVLGAEGGPSVFLNPPGGLNVSETFNVTGPQFSDTDETEFGTFGVNMGINASVTGTIGLSEKPLKPLELAHAFYTPGLLYTWNTYDNAGMGLNFAAFPSLGFISEADVDKYFDPAGADATVGATVTPYVDLSYGLYTPSSWPISLDIFDLTIGYQNPVTATLTVPVTDPSNSTLAVTSQGFITASAAFLPSITSSLSWKSKYQLYSADV